MVWNEIANVLMPTELLPRELYDRESDVLPIEFHGQEIDVVNAHWTDLCRRRFCRDIDTTKLRRLCTRDSPYANMFVMQPPLKKLRVDFIGRKRHWSMDEREPCTERSREVVVETGITFQHLWEAVKDAGPVSRMYGRHDTQIAVWY